MKTVKQTFLSTLIALAFVFSGCLSENMLHSEDSDNGEERSVSIRFVENGAATRAVSETQGETPATFNRGDLYFVSAGGTIIRHFSIGNTDDIANNLICVNMLRTTGVDIDAVPGQVNRVVIVGNTTGNVQGAGGNISNVGERLIDVFDQHDVDNVNLWGSAPLRRVPNVQQPQTNGRYLYEAFDGSIIINGVAVGGMTLRPTVARFELRELEAYGEIESFSVAGIFIDRSYRQARVSGTPVNFMSRGQDASLFVEGQPGYENTTNNALYDWHANSPNPFVFSQNANGNYVIVRPPAYVQGYRWTYNLFALYGNSDTPPPHIVIRLRDVTLDCGFVFPQDQFITVRGFRHNNQLREFIQAGNVYQVNPIRFSKRNLSPRPNENFVYANVTITLAYWNGQGVQMPGFRQPSPFGGTVECEESFTFHLDAATCGYCSNGTITYQWQWTATPNVVTSWTTVGLTNYTQATPFITPELTETRYFRRRATCSCTPSRVNYTFPARIVTDCPTPFLYVPPLLLFSNLANGGGAEQIANITASGPWTAVFLPANGIYEGNPPLPTTPQPVTVTTLPVGIKADANTGSQREASIRVTADGITRYIRVIQMQGTDTELEGLITHNPFVGAFWRHNQTGERLIRMPGDAAHEWIAVPLDNWIMLDRDLSPHVQTSEAGIDPETRQLPRTIRTNGQLPADAHDPVSGEGRIYFRIGLDGQIDANQHRWGRVVVLHGQNQQNMHIIWIRQGEAPHYVFTPTCPGALRNTTNVGRWSPFNLTHPDIRDGGDATAVFPPRSQMTDASNYFVRYPSQAGVFLQWATAAPHARRAWSPINAVDTWGTPVTYPNSWWDSAAINGVGATNARETCPVGYRRPGVVTNAQLLSSAPGIAASCMFRQSLWLNEDMGRINSVFGFYADGFFDRRPINATLEGHVFANSSVAYTTVEIASRGRLYFNPTTGYHLFLPAAGLRTTVGVPINTGFWGYYWDSTMSSQSSGWRLWVGNVISQLYPISNRAEGASVRCVAE